MDLCRKEKYLDSGGNRQKFPQCQANSVVTIATELSWLLKNVEILRPKTWLEELRSVITLRPHPITQTNLSGSPYRILF